MEKERSTKTLALVALIVAVIGVTVAFAAMATELTIGGTATMNTASWKVRFANLSETPETAGAASEAPGGSPTLTDLSVSDFSVILTKPGDSISYTFDVRNDGTLDATIESLLKNGVSVLAEEAVPLNCNGLAADPEDAEADAALVCGNLEYTLKYTVGNANVKKGDILEHNSVKNLTLTLAYNGSALPTDDVEISGLSIVINYVQIAD